MRSTELRLHAGGVQVCVVVPAEHAERLTHQWSWCLAPLPRDETSSPPAPSETLDVRPAYDTDGGGTPDLVAADYAVTQMVTAALVEALVGSRLMLHAAGVTHPEHGLLVLVAPSGTGKTTAARALAQRGLGYLSDETVVLDAEGRAHPYPKPLSVVLDGDAPSRKQQHSPDDVGLAPPTLPARASRVVLLERDDDHQGPPELSAAPTLDALVDLIPHSSALARLEQPLTWLVDLLDRCGGAFRLRYREVLETVPLLTTLLEEAPLTPTPTAAVTTIRPQPEERWGELDPQVGSVDAELPPLLRRERFLEAADDGAALLVLVGMMPALLGALGRTIWLTAAAPRSLDELRRACVEQHGDVTDAAALVDDAVRELLRHGLLRSAA